MTDTLRVKVSFFATSKDGGYLGITSLPSCERTFIVIHIHTVDFRQFHQCGTASFCRIIRKVKQRLWNEPFQFFFIFLLREVVCRRRFSSPQTTLSSALTKFSKQTSPQSKSPLQDRLLPVLSSPRKSVAPSAEFLFSRF